MKKPKPSVFRHKRICHWAPGVACPCASAKTCQFNLMMGFNVYTTKPPSEKVKTDKKNG